MYPEFLQENSQAYWTQEELFQPSKPDWVHALMMQDYAIGMHAQGFFEINIVTAGTGRHYIKDQSYAVGKGDAFIIPPDVRHGYMGGAGFDVFHMMICQKFLEKYIADLQTLPFFFTLFNAEPLMRISGSTPLYLKIQEHQLDELWPLLDALIKWAEPEDPIRAMMCNSIALMLITQLCAIYKENYRPADKAEDAACHAAFMESVAFIYEKYYEKIRIESLAKTAMLSRTAYISMFKRVMGTTPAKFILARRLESAKNMLANTPMPIADIAEKTGFYDASHFIRCFSRAEGRSPLAFREKAHSIYNDDHAQR